MGAALCRGAFEAAARAGVDHAPARLFAYMALIPLDSDPQPAFWRGQDDLVRALGAQPGAAGHRAVSRALKALADAGLIASDKAHAGRNARHRLMNGDGQPLARVSEEDDAHRRPSGGRSPSPTEEEDDAHRRPSGRRSASKRTTLSVQEDDAHRRPKEEDEEEEKGGRPSRSCERHPNGTTSPCGACGDARRRHDAWTPKRTPAPTGRCGHDLTPGSDRYCSHGCPPADVIGAAA